MPGWYGAMERIFLVPDHSNSFDTLLVETLTGDRVFPSTSTKEAICLSCAKVVRSWHRYFDLRYRHRTHIPINLLAPRLPPPLSTRRRAQRLLAGHASHLGDSRRTSPARSCRDRTAPFLLADDGEVCGIARVVFDVRYAGLQVEIVCGALPGNRCSKGLFRSGDAPHRHCWRQ